MINQIIQIGEIIVPDKRPQETEVYERYKHWLNQDEIPEEIILKYQQELETLKLKSEPQPEGQV